MITTIILIVVFGGIAALQCSTLIRQWWQLMRFHWELYTYLKDKDALTRDLLDGWHSSLKAEEADAVTAAERIIREARRP